MQSSERRWAYFYDFNLKSFPEDAPTFDFEVVLAKIKNAWENGIAVHKYRNEEITVRIKDFKLIEGYATALIHVSDIKATDPAFSNTETGHVRIEEKQKNEGIGVACHIIFCRKNIHNKKGNYLSIIEEAVGIPKSIIEQFLTYLFREHCSTKYHKIGSKSKEGNICRPKPVFKGHASETLKTSLAHSSLQGITLLSYNDGNYIDDDKELLMTEQIMKLKVIGNPSGLAAFNLIERARQIGIKKDYDEVRVQYSEIVAEESVITKQGEKKIRQVKKQRTLPFSAKEGDIANLLFTKSELIELQNEIGQCEDKIHTELANKMKNLLSDIMK